LRATDLPGAAFFAAPGFFAAVFFAAAGDFAAAVFLRGAEALVAFGVAALRGRARVSDVAKWERPLRERSASSGAGAV
jgi:hypothetical protein